MRGEEQGEVLQSRGGGRRKHTKVKEAQNQLILHVLARGILAQTNELKELRRKWGAIGGNFKGTNSLGRGDERRLEGNHGTGGRTTKPKIFSMSDQKGTLPRTKKRRIKRKKKAKTCRERNIFGGNTRTTHITGSGKNDGGEKVEREEKAGRACTEGFEVGQRKPLSKWKNRKESAQQRERGEKKGGQKKVVDPSPVRIFGTKGSRGRGVKQALTMAFTVSRSLW